VAARGREWNQVKSMQRIPWMLILLRVLGCPLIIVGAEFGWAGGLLSTIVLTMLLTDIYDGVLARRWGCESVRLRAADSIADTIFYLGIVAALWIREPQVLRGNWQFFAALFVLEGGRYVFDLLKFGRVASYHSYLAKIWGLLIAVAVVGAFSFGAAVTIIRLAVIFGIIVNLEGMGMSLILPQWKNDVKTLGRALALRQKMLQGFDTSD
jgi:phosphatidylglycerophosphate synthase